MVIESPLFLLSMHRCYSCQRITHKTLTLQLSGGPTLAKTSSPSICLHYLVHIPATPLLMPADKCRKLHPGEVKNAIQIFSSVCTLKKCALKQQYLKIVD